VKAVLMEMAIRACREEGKYIGICGQAPSDFPEITRWLVQQGIESIALNPDSVLKMTCCAPQQSTARAPGYRDAGRARPDAGSPVRRRLWASA
jgi:hypothetical protein